MRKHTSETKSGEQPGRDVGDVYPDISAIFNIEDDTLRDTSAEKVEVPQKGKRILTSPDGIRHLPKAEQKK